MNTATTGSKAQLAIPALVMLLSLAGPSVAYQKPKSGSDVPPPARSDVYLVPFSHLDYFWAGTREECLSRGNRIISKAIQLADRHPEFKFLIEDEDFVDNYAQTHSGSPELDALKRLVRSGRIEIAPKWAAIFQNLPPGEVLARNLIIGKRYARAQFGVDPLVAHITDIPGFTPQFPQLLARADIPFMVMTRLGPADKSLFYWQAPDGSQSLVWNTLKGYFWAAELGLHKDLDQSKIDRFKAALTELRATTQGPVYLNWGLDLWAPSDRLIDNVGRLNEKLPGTGTVIATPTEFFETASKEGGLPVVRGGIPSGWPNISTSLVNLWQWDIPATNTLLAAERFATISYAMGYSAYPQSQLDFLWRKLIESMDHNHDGQGGRIGDDRKEGDSQMVILAGGEILRDSLRNIAERVKVAAPGGTPITVFNPLSWSRSDIVHAHVTLFGDVSPADLGDFREGVKLVDETGHSVPFHVERQLENISRALEITFIASGVPSLGYKTYYLVPAAEPGAYPNASTIELDSDKDAKEPRRPLGADVMENEFYRVTIDKATGRVRLFDRQLNRDVCKDMEIAAVEERGGNNVSSEHPTGRTIFDGIENTSLIENNPVRTVYRIRGNIADVPVEQTLTLYQGLKRLDMEDAVDWPGSRFLNIQQVFPIPAESKIEYGVAYGAEGTDDVMPQAGPRFKDETPREIWKDYREIQDWINASGKEWGLTIAADHQSVQLLDGAIKAGLLRGLRFTSARVVESGQVKSLQYPPPGRYVFKYSVSSAPGDWKTSDSYRTGLAFNNPLIPVTSEDDVSTKTLPPSMSFCSVPDDGIVISALKKADDAPAIIVRMYEAKGAAIGGRINLLGKDRTFREVNLLEQGAGAELQDLALKPFEIKTIVLQ